MADAIFAKTGWKFLMLTKKLANYFKSLIKDKGIFDLID